MARCGKFPLSNRSKKGKFSTLLFDLPPLPNRKWLLSILRTALRNVRVRDLPLPHVCLLFLQLMLTWTETYFTDLYFVVCERTVVLEITAVRCDLTHRLACKQNLPICGWPVTADAWRAICTYVHCRCRVLHLVSLRRKQDTFVFRVVAVLAECLSFCQAENLRMRLAWTQNNFFWICSPRVASHWSDLALSYTLVVHRHVQVLMRNILRSNVCCLLICVVAIFTCAALDMLLETGNAWIFVLNYVTKITGVI